MPLRVRSLAALLVALAAVVALGGCRTPGDGGSGGGELEDLPGVREAYVGPREYDDGVSARYAIVDADPDISAAQLTDVLVAMGEADPEHYLVYLGAGTTELDTSFTDPPSVLEGGEDPEAGAGDTAALFVAAAGVAGVTADVDTTRGRVELTLADGDVASLAPAADAVVADPVLAAVPSLTLSVVDAQPAARTVVATLASEPPFTAALVEDWRRQVAVVAGLTGPRVVRQRLTVGATGQPAIDLTLGFDGIFGDRLTPQEYGDALWPVLRPLLDELAAGSVGGALRVGREDDPELGTDVFLDLALAPDGTTTVAPDPRGRGWGEQAAAYLAG